MKDIFYDGKIYKDIANTETPPISYPVQGTHNFKDGEDVTGKYFKDEILSAYGLETRYYDYTEKYGYGCGECCNGDRCDSDCRAKYKGNRKNCPHCKGKGFIQKDTVEKTYTIAVPKKPEYFQNPVIDEIKKKIVDDIQRFYPSIPTNEPSSGEEVQQDKSAAEKAKELVILFSQQISGTITATDADGWNDTTEIQGIHFTAKQCALICQSRVIEVLEDIGWPTLWSEIQKQKIIFEAIKNI